MMIRDFDPVEIGKHPEMIRKAQAEMAKTDVLVCGNCHCVYHFIQQFEQHKKDGCTRDSPFKDSRESKPKVWAFLLWKASQLSKEKDINVNSWKLYQAWVKLDESKRETWVVAGRTIQSFARVGQGTLQEMPVKITKTILENDVPAEKKTTQNPPSAIQKPSAIQRPLAIQRPISSTAAVKKNDDEDGDSSKDDTKMVKKVPTRSPLTKLPANVNSSTTKLSSREALRTNPDGETEEETVEKVMAKRFNPRLKMYEYLVKWQNSDTDTWEPATHLENCSILLDNFEKLLARQKEQKAKQQAAAAGTSNESTDGGEQSGGLRPVRNSKSKAFDQVKQWLADDGGVGKRKADDSDYDDESDDDDDMMGNSPKRQKSDMVKDVTSTLLKAGQAGNVRIIQVSKTGNSTAGGSTQNPVTKMNGTAQQSTPKPQTLDRNSAEVVVTNGRDGKQSGIIKKPGASPATQTNKDNVRVVTKSDTSPSGVVRVQPKITTVNRSTPLTTRSGPSQPIIRSINSPAVTSKMATTARPPIGRPITSQQQQQQVNAKSVVSRSASVQQISRTSTSPNVQPISANKPVINRIVKSAPTSKQTTPDQKVAAINRQGNIQITKRPPIKSIPDDDPFNEPPVQISNSPPPALTLCPITGQVLGRAEGEPSPVASPEPEPKVITQTTQQIITTPTATISIPGPMGQKADQTMTTSIFSGTGGNAVTSTDGQMQQLIANEDGTPIIVTGEDGTLYQVAGKNEQGETVLIAQGGDGEQQCVYVATEDSEGNSVLTLSQSMTDAVAQQQILQTSTQLVSATDGQYIMNNPTSDASQPLTISTAADGDSQDGQITAEVVQAELPSPGGTRRVVLLLPDGSYMMTEVNQEQYESLNLAT